MFQNIKALLFDLDGTLVDSMWMWKQIDIEYLARYQLSCPDDLQPKIEGMSFTETAVYFKERFQIPDPLEKIKSDWNEMTLLKYRDEVPMKKGALDFIRLANKMGLKLGIATSNSRELVLEVARAHDIDRYFDCIKTACEVEKGKPSPDIYLAVARDLGVKPDECMVFEDIAPGILAGLNAGMNVCAVEDQYSLQMADEKKQLANYYITDYDEIISKLSEAEASVRMELI